MSNLLTLTQDEIKRFDLKGKQPGDVITAEEYSKLAKTAEKKEAAAEAKSEDKPSKK